MIWSCLPQAGISERKSYYLEKCKGFTIKKSCYFKTETWLSYKYSYRAMCSWVALMLIRPDNHNVNVRVVFRISALYFSSCSIDKVVFYIPLGCVVSYNELAQLFWSTAGKWHLYLISSSYFLPILFTVLGGYGEQL